MSDEKINKIEELKITTEEQVQSENVVPENVAEAVELKPEENATIEITDDNPTVVQEFKVIDSENIEEVSQETLVANASEKENDKEESIDDEEEIASSDEDEVEEEERAEQAGVKKTIISSLQKN